MYQKTPQSCAFLHILRFILHIHTPPVLPVLDIRCSCYSIFHCLCHVCHHSAPFSTFYCLILSLISMSVFFFFSLSLSLSFSLLFSLSLVSLCHHSSYYHCKTNSTRTAAAPPTTNDNKSITSQ